MTIRRAAAAVRAVALTAGICWLAAGPALAVEVNRIVLRVNNRILTLHDYEKRKAERISALQRADLPADRRQELLARAGEDALRAAYEELLLLARADQLGLEATDAEVESAIEQTKASFGIQTEADFERALAQSNLTLAALREQMRSNLRMQMAIGAEVRPRIDIDDEDLRRYYQAHPDEFRLPERVELREVVVLDSSGLPAAELEELANDLRSRLLDGSLTEEELADYREQGLATEWIQLGWVQPGDLDPALEEAVFNMEVGAVTEPLTARGGLHLVQVLDHKEPELMSFAEVEEQIQRIESDRLFAEVMQEYMEELAAESYIVSRPPPEAANFRTLEKRGPRDPLAKLGVRETTPTPPE